jgi:hypothetical protein
MKLSGRSKTQALVLWHGSCLDPPGSVAFELQPKGYQL